MNAGVIGVESLCSLKENCRVLVSPLIKSPQRATVNAAGPNSGVPAPPASQNGHERIVLDADSRGQRLEARAW